MKRFLALLTLLTLAPGCIAPNYTRLIPENKDARVIVWSPLYGWCLIETRASGSTNAFTPVPLGSFAPAPAPAP